MPVEVKTTCLKMGFWAISTSVRAGGREDALCSRVKGFAEKKHPSAAVCGVMSHLSAAVSGGLLQNSIPLQSVGGFGCPSAAVCGVLATPLRFGYPSAAVCGVVPTHLEAFASFCRQRTQLCSRFGHDLEAFFSRLLLCPGVSTASRASQTNEDSVENTSGA